MPSHASLLGFALVSLGMVLTPGPNMIYLISRSITQGPAAGIVSLGGVAIGFVFYMLCAAFGINPLRRASEAIAGHLAAALEGKQKAPIASIVRGRKV